MSLKTKSRDFRRCVCSFERGAAHSLGNRVWPERIGWNSWCQTVL